ncbi:MAG: flagellin lysine-N-methylase [Clostridia bacterium]|nr:flagellin lysine-N-methylase [Clostridia bacterium]
MRLIAPDYYPAFRCIADRCRHSCCIGWEIDIDPSSRERYRRISGAFGQRLNAAIEDTDAGAWFRLDGDERCPMLNENGLCDLITACGEETLCQICADHPRFRSFFADRTEIGLGLCCEAAALLVLGREEPVRLVTLEDDGGKEVLPESEAALLKRREALISIAQDRRQPVVSRLQIMLESVDAAIPERDWIAVYRALERLDPAWDVVLDTLREAAPPEHLSAAFEQFTVYLLYRHLPGALEDSDIPGRVMLCVLSVQMLMALCASREGCTLADCAELARMYSAEIEYSEDNIAALLDALWESCSF